MKLKVLSYNVHKLFNLMRTHYFLKTLKEYLSTMDLDIVFLQEIRGMQPNKYQKEFDLDPLEHLADEIWDHFVYGKNAIYSSGSHGNAILSKYPIHHWENINISNHPLEKRSLLKASIMVEDMELHLACTHLDLTRKGRSIQADKILRLLKDRYHHPLILGGDFNDWKGEVRQTFQDHGLSDVFETREASQSYTFPAILPMLPLDRIFYRNLSCHHHEVLNEARWKNLSDHLPILAEFTAD